MEQSVAHRRVVSGRRLGGVIGAAALTLGFGGRAPAPVKPGPPPRVFVFLSAVGGAELTHLRSFGERISVVAPNWYALDAGDQTLSGSASLAVAELTRAAGAQLWPVVNARLRPGDDLESPAVRARITAAVAALARAHDYDGMTLDIEQLPAGESAAFTALARAVGSALHAQGERLAVYVPRQTATGGDAAYDWPALLHAADLLIASGYDEHSATSAPGPVTTSGGFADVAAYAAGVNRWRIAPALGAFGYVWPVAGGLGRLISTIDAGALQRRTGARGETVDGDTTFSPGAGQVVYYQGAADLAAEAQTARDDGLRWLALFSLGREPAGFWSDVRTARQPPLKASRG